MAVTRVAELRELDEDELEARLAESRRELLNLRFQLATGQLDNVARLGEVRRDVARVLTVLRERDFAAAEAEGVRHDEVAAHERVPRRLPPITSIAPDRPRAEEAEEEDEGEEAEDATLAAPDESEDEELDDVEDRDDDEGADDEGAEEER